MRAALIALLLTFASQAGAECGKLCDWKWWETATTADVQAELSGGADVMARNGFGSTPLYSAAGYGTPASIQALLDAGADVMARDEERVSDLLCMSDLVHASKLKEHDDNDDIQRATGRAA
jgi:ankyrin repeat protein